MESLERTPSGLAAPILPEALYAVPVSLVDAILCCLPQVDLPVRTLFGPGFAVREMVIPAGTLIVARMYTSPHVCICSGGEITVWGDGVAPVVISGGEAYEAQAGVQRVGYAHQETIWSTVLPNPENLPDPEAVLALASFEPPVPEELIGLPVEALLALLPTPETRKLLVGGTLA
jgi:hypothetical protein